MSLIRTGDGKVDIRQDGDLVTVLLYNFDNDGDEVKEKSHKADLRKWIIEPILLREPDLVVHISGHASRRGPAGYNLDLSRRRVANVRSFLQGEGVREERFKEFAFAGWGEAVSIGGGVDEETHRSVLLVITRPEVPVINIRLPRPAPRDDRDRIVLRRLPVSHEFAIRVEFMVRANVAPAVEAAYIALTFWDTESMRIAVYAYGGPGISASLPIVPFPGSLNVNGDWNCFHTPGPIRVEDFSGAALFQRASIATDSAVRFKMLGSAVTGANRGQPLVIDPLTTGAGFGSLSLVGGQANSGLLILMPHSVMRFNDSPRLLLPSGLAPSCDARASQMRRVGGRAVR